MPSLRRLRKQSPRRTVAHQLPALPLITYGPPVFNLPAFTAALEQAALEFALGMAALVEHVQAMAEALQARREGRLH